MHTGYTAIVKQLWEHEIRLVNPNTTMACSEGQHQHHWPSDSAVMKLLPNFIFINTYLYLSPLSLVFLSSPVRSGTLYVEQTDEKLIEIYLPAASQELRMKAPPHLV